MNMIDREGNFTIIFCIICMYVHLIFEKFTGKMKWRAQGARTGVDP